MSGNRVINGGSNGSVSAAHDSELTARLGAASNGSGWRVTFTTSDTTHTNTLRFYIPIQSSLSLSLSLRLRCLLLGSVVLLKANRATFTQKVNIDENTNTTKDSFFFFLFSLFIIIIFKYPANISIIWGTKSNQTGSVLLLERDKQKKRRNFAAIKLSKLSVAAVTSSLCSQFVNLTLTLSGDSG